MYVNFEYDPKLARKTSYSKTECLNILEVLLYQRDQIDKFDNRLRQFVICFLRIFSKNLFSQKLQTPVPPQQWITQMISFLNEQEGEELSTNLFESDAYRKIWQSVSSLCMIEPYWGKTFCEYNFISFLSNTKFRCEVRVT